MSWDAFLKHDEMPDQSDGVSKLQYTADQRAKSAPLPDLIYCLTLLTYSSIFMSMISRTYETLNIVQMFHDKIIIFAHANCVSSNISMNRFQTRRTPCNHNLLGSIALKHTTPHVHACSSPPMISLCIVWSTLLHEAVLRKISVERKLPTSYLLCWKFKRMLYGIQHC